MTEKLQVRRQRVVHPPSLKEVERILAPHTWAFDCHWNIPRTDGTCWTNRCRNYHGTKQSLLRVVRSLGAQQLGLNEFLLSFKKQTLRITLVQLESKEWFISVVRITSKMPSTPSAEFDTLTIP